MARPVQNSVFGRRCRKMVSWGREDTRVWYLETVFSKEVSYDFPMYGPLHEYFVPRPLTFPARNPEGVANQEG